jgi:O-antigen ligase
VTEYEKSARPLLGLLAGGAAVVPCLFTTRLPDVFGAPKLAGLWLVLIAGLLIVALGPVVGSPSGAPLRFERAVDGAGISLLVLNLLAAAFSTDRRQSLFGERLQHQGLLTLLLYLGLFLLARHAVSDVRRLTVLFSGISAGAAAVAGYAVLQKAGVDPFWDGFLPEGRVFSTLGQPNALAAYLVIALPPACYLAAIARGMARLALVLVVVEIVAAVLLTSSRGGLVALLAMAGLAGGLALRTSRLARRAAGPVLAASIAALLVPPVRHAVAAGWREFASRGGDAGSRSTRNHLDIWRVAARITREHLLLGTGQETFPDSFARSSRAVLSPERLAYFDAFRVESAHNVYLTMSANTGVPALLAYLAVVGAFLLVALRAARSTTDRNLGFGLLTLAAAVAGHLVSDLFMTADITSTWLFWTLLGAGWGVLSTAAVAAKMEDDPGEKG